MKRAAIYARFSTDLQSDRSITDQVSVCRDFALAKGLTIVGIFKDEAISGGSIVNRNGMLDLLAAANNGEFDVVVVEALDRLSRDMEGLAGVYKRLTFANVEIMALNEGAINSVLIGLRGLIGQLYREDNVHKIRRGLAGRVKDGLSAGGRAYGYRPDAQHKGKLLVNEDEADIVRRIFSEFRSGASPRQIAYKLNRDHVPPPRGRVWNASTINGSPQRGNGILRNQLYAGRIVWDKVKMVTDPETAKRVSRANPSEGWLASSVPEYQIVDSELFDDVAGILETRGGNRPETYRRARRPLSGLLRCGACGAGMSTSGKDRSGRVRIRCSAARESGTCPDPKTFYLDTIEEAVFSLLLKELRSPEMVTTFIETYQRERRQLVADAQKNVSRLRKRLAEVETGMGRLVTAIEKGVMQSEDVGERANELRAEKSRIQQELRNTPVIPDKVTLHPAALRHYQRQLTDLREQFQKTIDRGDSEAMTATRELIDTVTVRRGSEGAGAVDVQITGKLNALVGLPGFGGRAGVGNGGSGGGT